MRRLLLPLACLLPCLVVGCDGPSASKSDATPSPQGRSQPRPAETPEEALPPMEAAREYLLSSLSDEGRFVYQQHVDLPGDQSEGRYNVLRHAGTVYALDQVQRTYPEARTRAGIIAAASYLAQTHLKQVEGLKFEDQPVWVIASRVEEESARPVAKLGGAGLGLVALTAGRSYRDDLVDLERLRGLARFIRYAQAKDGSFQAKLFLDVPGGKWSTFVSLYYPGEAILGLMRLYAIDPDPAWLECAARAAAYLARARATIPDERIPHDHWLLIAGGELLPLWSKLKDPPCELSLLRAHLDQLARVFLRLQAGVTKAGRYPGCFSPKGAVCPSATRLEGLAAYADLPAEGASEGAPTREAVLQGIASGADFLRRAQLGEEWRLEIRGGFPRALLTKGKRPGPRGELRIDFTQHALSALHGADRLEASESKNR